MANPNRKIDQNNAQLNSTFTFSPEQLLIETRRALVSSPQTRVSLDCPNPKLINVLALSPTDTETLDIRTLCPGNRLPTTKEGHLFEFDKPCERCIMEPYHQTVFRQENGRSVVYLYTGNY